MKLEDILSQKRSAILERWFHLILETYPADTTAFFKKQKDRFANPVAYTILEGIEGLFDHLLQDMDSDKVSPFLDRIIRIRAVQDFSPSEAMAFIFLLKKVIREELESEVRENRVSDEELLTLELRIDDLALLSFDIYAKCREKVYELKVSETKRMLFGPLKRANLIYEMPEQEPEVKRPH